MTHNFEHQDHKVIVFSKKKPINNNTNTPQKSSIEQYTQPTIKIKEDEDGEIIKNDKFNPSFVKEVIQKRVDKKMNRKVLAQKLGIPENDLARFEQNKMVYKGQLVDKIKRILGRDFTNLPKN
jgi:ribosome-binding protein aMBF1 (putative translation factor)